MTLGLLVNTDKHAEDIIAITKIAAGRGHKVIIFFMDEGCRLATDIRINSLLDMEDVKMSLCDLNRAQMAINKVDIPEGITCGSQYDNAVMNRDADKIIVL